MASSMIDCTVQVAQQQGPYEVVAISLLPELSGGVMASSMIDCTVQVAQQQGPYETVAISLPPELSGRAVASLHELLIKGQFADRGLTTCT